MFLANRVMIRWGVLVVSLSLIMPLPQLKAADHIVTTSELHEAITAASQARHRNIEQVKHLLATTQAKKALQKAKLDATRVQEAVTSLSDAELERLAQQATMIQVDFAGGAENDKRFTDEHITLIVQGTILIIVIALVGALA